MITRNKIALLLIILLDVLSIGILIPVLPTLFQSLSLPSLVANTDINTVLWYSLIIGLHPICAFFSAPFLGTLSDKVGRKWVLVVSLIGTVFGFGISVVGVEAGSLLLLALGRFIDGCTAGNIAVARASLLDMSRDEESTTSNLGLVGALFGIGMLLGPLLGGITWALFGLSQAAATLTIAIMSSLLAMLTTIFFFKETHDYDSQSTHSFRLLPKPEQVLVPHVISGIVYVLGFGMFTMYWAIFVFNEFNFSQTQLSHMFVFIGLCIAITQGVIVRRLAKRFKPKPTLLVALPLLALSMIILSNTTLSWLYGALAFFALWNGLVMANRLSLISEYGVRFGKGYISGIDSAYTSLASACAPILLAIASFGGSLVPFWVSAALFFLTLCIIIVAKPYKFIAQVRQNG